MAEDLPPGGGDDLFDRKRKTVYGKHDPLVRVWLGNSDGARLLIKEWLPQDVQALIKPGTPVRIPGNFVDERLAGYSTDLLYQVELKGGGSAFVYFLIEHKSENDPRTPLQLLRYMTNIWSRTDSPRGRPDLPLPPIIPLVIYNGEPKWSVKSSFHGLFGRLHRKFRPLTPQFEYFFVDLNRVGDNDLSADERQRLFMTALKLARRRDMLDRVFRLFARQAIMDILAVLHYILSLHADIGRDDIDRLLRKYEPERSGGIMNAFTQEYFDRGKAEGRVEGRVEGMAEGEAKGQAKTLVALLTLRFGKLPVDVEERIRKSSVETLERWTSRVFNGGTLADVIGD